MTRCVSSSRGSGVVSGVAVRPFSTQTDDNPDEVTDRIPYDVTQSQVWQKREPE